MQLFRMFSTSSYKGRRNYISSQKKFEILRTLLYFGISVSLFIAGLIATKTRVNLLTIVAVLGCLPASKSAVNMIMFLRYHSCPAKAADRIEAAVGTLPGLFDLVFTSYEKNYYIAHLTVRGNTLCGYTDASGFDEKAFYRHMDTVLRTDNFKGINVKIFTDLKKYTDRLNQLQQLEADDTYTDALIATIKSVTL